MHPTDRITAQELLHELMPGLSATEQVVQNTLRTRINFAFDAAERERLQELQAEFELELEMIRRNLEHLQQRYAGLLNDYRSGDGRFDHLALELDAHEAIAVASARQLYNKARAIQSQ